MASQMRMLKFNSLFSETLLFRLFTSALIASVLCLASPSASHATDWPALEARIKTVVGSPEFVEAVLDQYQFQGNTRAVMRTHLTELYRSEEVIKALFAEIRNLGIDSHAELYGDNPWAFGQKFGAQLIQSWAIKGIARLPAADQRSFYRYILQWMTVATPEDCKQMMISSDKSALENGRLELKYFYRMSQSELETYLALLRKSIFAELRDFPSTRTLSGEQLQIAEKAFTSSFAEMIKSEGVGMDVVMAFSDPKSARPQQACDAGKLVLKTLMNMKGLPGDWMALKLVLSGQ